MSEDGCLCDLRLVMSLMYPHLAQANLCVFSKECEFLQGQLDLCDVIASNRPTSYYRLSGVGWVDFRGTHTESVTLCLSQDICDEILSSLR